MDVFLFPLAPSNREVNPVLMHRRRLLGMPLDWESPVIERFNALHRPTIAAQRSEAIEVNDDTQQAKFIEDLGSANPPVINAASHSEPINMDNNIQQAETSPETPFAYVTSESSLDEEQFDIYVPDEDEPVETWASTSPAGYTEETGTFVDKEHLERCDPEGFEETQESTSSSDWTQESETFEEEQFEMVDADELEEMHVSASSSVYPTEIRRIDPK
ncbi:hypothetical protein BDN70DRAFT_900680 [Pholiota conissans]|uniref:Uncharacterized protein n=1 Tax=Pholiota conissans TaxID=109636 RepID=A0A9P5YPC2_9AGAR|nr:hypothetical protein BDN70DRAFT_900680 [Pholiota conissans]